MGAATGAEHDHIRDNGAAVVEVDPAAAIVGVHGGDLGAGADVETVFAELGGGQFADAGVFAVEQAGPALDEGHLGAHAREELAEFDADGAAADHHNSVGDLTQGGGLPVVHTVPVPGPGIGGRTGAEPVASTTWRGVISWSAAWTCHGSRPTSRAAALMTVTPWFW